jgi:hypothetical protein
MQSLFKAVKNFGFISHAMPISRRTRKFIGLFVVASISTTCGKSVESLRKSNDRQGSDGSSYSVNSQSKLSVNFNFINGAGNSHFRASGYQFKLRCGGNDSNTVRSFVINPELIYLRDLFAGTSGGISDCSVDLSSLTIKMTQSSQISGETLSTWNCSMDHTRGTWTARRIGSAESNGVEEKLPAVGQKCIKQEDGVAASNPESISRNFALAKNFPSGSIADASQSETVEIVINEFAANDSDDTIIRGGVTGDDWPPTISPSAFPFEITSFRNSSGLNIATEVKCVDLIAAGVRFDTSRLPASDIAVQKRNPWCTDAALPHAMVSAINCSNNLPKSATNIPANDIINIANLQSLAFLKVTGDDKKVSWLPSNNGALASKDTFEKVLPLVGSKTIDSCIVLAVPKKAPDANTLESISIYDGSYAFIYRPFPPLVKHTLSVDISGSGSVTRDPDQESYTHDTSVTLTAAAAPGHDFLGWGGACAGQQPTCTVVMDSDKAVTAQFVPQQFDLVLNRNGNGSGSFMTTVNGTATSSRSFPRNTVVTITASPDAGSSFSGFNGCEPIPPSIVTCSVSMSENRTVSGTFSVLHQLTVNIVGSGSVSRNPEAPLYVQGTRVTLTANASINSDFIGWSGACSGAGTSCTVTMDSAKTVTANFESKQHSLSINASGTGSGSITKTVNGQVTNNNSFPHGTVVTLIATPQDNSDFSVWSGDCSGAVNSCTVTMDANKSATGKFDLKKYSLTLSNGGTGSGSIGKTTGGLPTNETSFVHGTVVILTATPTVGSDFTGWLGACSGTAMTCTITMDSAKTVNANFAIKTYSLAITYPGTGAGSVRKTVNGQLTSSNSFEHGTVVTISATPQSWSNFTAWGGDCSGAVPTCTITMNANKNVQVIFSPKQYGLVINIAGTGTGSVTKTVAGQPTDESTFSHGTVVILTANASAESNFAGWSGGCSGIQNTCSVTMDGARSVTATFTPRIYTLSITTAGDGEGTFSKTVGGQLTNNTSFAHGTVVTISPTPLNSSDFVGWGGDCGGAMNTCAITMNENKGVIVNFNRKQYSLVISNSGNGTGAVTKAVGGVQTTESKFKHGTEITLTATSATGSDFTGWSGACAGTATTCVITMDNAKSATANFALKKYSLTINATGIGSGSFTKSINGQMTDSTSFDHGTVVTITATAGQNSAFTGFVGCEPVSPTVNTCAVAMDQNRIVTGNFTKTYGLSVSTNGRGTVSKIPEQTVYNHGSIVTLTATPNADSNFIGWSGACSGTSVTCSLTMDSAKSVTANFAIKRFTLTLSTAGNGAGSFNKFVNYTPTNEAVFDYGTVVTIYAVSASSSVFSAWSGDCSATGNTCTVTMTSDKMATATFTLQKFNLTINQIGNGSGSVRKFVGGQVTTATTFDWGTDVTISPTPATGSTFTGWSGACMGQGQSCVLRMDSNKSTGASFSLNTYAVTLLQPSNTAVKIGAIISDPGNLALCTTAPLHAVPHGCKVTITAESSNPTVFGPGPWTGITCSGPATTACTIASLSGPISVGVTVLTLVTPTATLSATNVNGNTVTTTTSSVGIIEKIRNERLTVQWTTTHTNSCTLTSNLSTFTPASGVSGIRNLEDVQFDSRNKTITLTCSTVTGTTITRTLNVITAGRWLQATGACGAFCTARSMTSRASPYPADFQHLCTSGENFVPTSVNAGAYSKFIAYSHGNWGGGMYEPNFSDGNYCWYAAQKRDNDQTDLTVGCYCSYQ